MDFVGWKKLFKTLLVIGLACLCCGVVQAQTSDGDYKQNILSKQTLPGSGGASFGEQVNTMTGALTFGVEDVRLKGIGPDIVIHRSTNFSTGMKMTQGFGNWTFDFPSLEIMVAYAKSGGPPRTPGDFWSSYGDGSTTPTYTRCTSTPMPSAAYIWDNLSSLYDGVKFNDGESQSQLIGRGAQNSIAPSGQTATYPYIAEQGKWQFRCLPTTSNGQKGEAFLAVGPDGTQYYLDNLMGYPTPDFSFVDGAPPARGAMAMRAVMGVSRIVDRFGNWVAYHYNGNQIASIDASDGRLVQFTYDSTFNAITRIDVEPNTPSARTWQYQYAAPTGQRIALDNGADASLTRVILPDGSTWEYAGIQTVNWSHQIRQPYNSTCPRSGDAGVSGSFTSTVKAPSGATAAFTMIPIWHGRSYVPSAPCYQAPNQSKYTEAIATVFQTYSLTQKTITGPGLPASTWSYSYSTAVGSSKSDPCGVSGTCPDSAYVDTIDPAGIRTRSTFSTRMDETEGKLRSVQTYTGAGALLRQVDYQYAAKGQGPYPSQLGSIFIVNFNPATDLFITPLRSTVITQDGVTFSSYVNSYDAFARPLSIGKWSSLGYSKSDVTEYYDDTAHWVLGQIKRHYNGDTGLVDARNEYDPNTALVLQTYAFEKLKATMTYNADGTLAASKDGLNNTTTYSNWKRGIPQTIQYADGTSISAIVNDNGWITAVTDENGYATGYGYDAMGRVAAITYPNEATFNYNTTTITFAPSAAAAYGLPAGHWEQVTQTGNRKKIVVFDGLWRPVAEQEEDIGASSTTLHWLAKRYDSDGHLIFQSYPINPYVSGWKNFTDSLAGVNTTYDALGRATQVQQDSELGTLTTTTEYLTGFQVRTTNPRGYQTTSGYQVYDQPSYDQLAWSAQPENKDVTITRNYFGLPLTITQADHANAGTSVTRSYAYDGYMQLCKSLEPETGATVMDYDAAGNLAWNASGLRGSADYDTPNTCSAGLRPAASASGNRVDRSYDARNRVLSLSFPDGVGNQSWQYTPDGLASQITTYNEANNGAPVVNAYHYNKRRLLDGSGESVSQDGWYTWAIGHGYDANASLTTEVYPGSEQVSYAPNALGQPTQVASQIFTYATGVSYYPNGGISQFTYGNGIVHTMAQNVRQLPSRSTDAGVINYGFTYDGNANPTAISDDQQGATYNRTMTYDGLDRLTTAQSGAFGGTDQTHRFSYDALDNIKSWKLAGVKDYANYIYDASNRLTQINTTAGTATVTLTYDVRGNLASKGSQGYYFDYGNRLRWANGQESYRYDGYGRRVTSYSPSPAKVPIMSMYDAGGVLRYQRDERQNKVLNYMYLGGSLVAMRETTLADMVHVAKYQHTDALGSPVAITNQAGQVIERTAYEPYGSMIGKPNNDRPGYTGHVMDSQTGLTYMQQRYYDPAIGRFLSTDPVQANANTGASFNRFAYANNNPYKFTDPDGRDSASCYGDKGCGGNNSFYASKEKIGMIADMLPGIGIVKGIVEAFQNPSPVTIGLAVISVIPEGGGVAKTVLKEAGVVTKEAASVGRATSQIDRAAFAKERSAFWKQEAAQNGSKYGSSDLARMEKGKPPIGSDGHPMELHHTDRTPTGGLEPMTRTDHRLGENYKINHPDP